MRNRRHSADKDSFVFFIFAPPPDLSYEMSVMNGNSHQIHLVIGLLENIEFCQDRVSSYKKRD
jgi:hypothetical protein